jgi:hypothetical protein
MIQDEARIRLRWDKGLVRTLEVERERVNRLSRGDGSIVLVKVEPEVITRSHAVINKNKVHVLRKKKICMLLEFTSIDKSFAVVI